MKDFNHTFSFSTDWRKKFLDELGGYIESDQRIMSFKPPIAEGETFFMEIAPGFAVLLIDAVLNIPLRLVRLPSEGDFWIIYYDLSDDINRHTVNKSNFEVGDSSKFGLGVIDSRIVSSYNIEMGNHLYSLRLFIDKKLMKTYLNKSKLTEEFKDVFDRRKKKIFFYKNIDSRSKVALFNLKQQRINDFYFEFEIKSSAYQLLGYFLERINVEVAAKMIYEKDAEALEKSQDFLISQLYLSFPGIEKLATKANMSASKYNKAYKAMYGSSPATFFKQEKLKLATELLLSGKFKYISEVVFEMGYNKTTYFTLLYKNNFGVLPSEIFVKRED